LFRQLGAISHYPSGFSLSLESWLNAIFRFCAGEFVFTLVRM